MVRQELLMPPNEIVVVVFVMAGDSHHDPVVFVVGILQSTRGRPSDDPGQEQQQQWDHFLPGQDGDGDNYQTTRDNRRVTHSIRRAPIGRECVFHSRESHGVDRAFGPATVAEGHHTGITGSSRTTTTERQTIHPRCVCPSSISYIHKLLLWGEYQKIENSRCLQGSCEQSLCLCG